METAVRRLEPKLNEVNFGLGTMGVRAADGGSGLGAKGQNLRRRWGAGLFLLIVVIPVGLYSLYLAVFATGQYVSEFRVLVRTPAQTQQIGLSAIAGLSLSSQANDNAYAIIQYLKSQQAATALDTREHLRQIYSSRRIDPLSRLSPRASDASLTRYWNHKLDAYYENTTDTVVVKIAAFDPQTALALSRATLRLSEDLVNDMSRRSRADVLAYAQNDVEAARQRLEGVNASMSALQNQRDLIDPRQAATAELERRSKIQDEITATQVDLAARRPFQSPGSAVMQALYKRLAALKSGLGAIDSEAVAKGSASDRTLSGSIAAFEKVQADQEFAQKEYQAALAALQAARDTNGRQQIYLDTVVSPTQPDETSFPNYPKQIGIFTLFAIAAWGLAVAAIQYGRERV
jgi:capsular polysaccharide transport system permease protein